MNTSSSPSVSENEVDRLRELTSIGAGHAASALARVIDRPCTTRVPTVRLLSPERIETPCGTGQATGEDRMGVFFELEGGPGGVVALLFPGEVRDRLLELLLGPGPKAPEVAESALRELGNIVVSHVASSIADALSTPVVPSVPMLAVRDAGRALAALLVPRAVAHAALRIECEIADRSREIRALLVYLPDVVVGRSSSVAAAPSSSV